MSVEPGERLTRPLDVTPVKECERCPLADLIKEINKASENSWKVVNRVNKIVDDLRGTETLPKYDGSAPDAGGSIGVCLIRINEIVDNLHTINRQVNRI